MGGDCARPGTPRIRFTLRFLLGVLIGLGLSGVVCSRGLSQTIAVCRGCGSLQIEEPWLIWVRLPVAFARRTRGTEVTRFLQEAFGVRCTTHAWTAVPSFSDCKPSLYRHRSNDGSSALRFIHAVEAGGGLVLDGLAATRPEEVRAFVLLGISDYYFEARQFAEILRSLTPGEERSRSAIDLVHCRAHDFDTAVELCRELRFLDATK